jgi:hypothetical protein
MRKIINICIFALAGLAALLGVLFGFGFNQDAKDKFYSTIEVKANNPQMLNDLLNATVETLPEFVTKYEEILGTHTADLKQEKLQRDIFYTFIFHLQEVTDQETFDIFKEQFPEYSKLMFAKADKKEYFISGFDKVKSYTDFESYYTSLNADYENVRQDYLAGATTLKAELSLLKQAGDIDLAISVTKKEYDLQELQKNIKSYKTEATEFNITMNLFYVLFFVTLAAMIFFLLWNVFINIKSNIALLAGIGIMVLLVIIGYVIASPELTAAAVKEQLTTNNMKWVGAGLFTFYCMFFGTIAAILGTIIINAIKKAK